MTADYYLNFYRKCEQGLEVNPDRIEIPSNLILSTHALLHFLICNALGGSLTGCGEQTVLNIS